MIKIVMDEYRKPLPLPDADSQPFWESCRNHAMALQECIDCRRFRYPPRSLCPYCHSPNAAWKAVSGKGRVYVSLTMCRPYGPAWEADVPYNISMIELDEGVRIWSNIIGCPPEQITIGDRVTIRYEDVTDNITLPKFRLIE
jgi:uncharacterized OB-fold protein